MSLNFQMNQFTGSQIKGLITELVSPFTLPMQVDAGQATPILPGAAVQLAATAGQGAFLVTECAASDAPIGFVAFSEKKNSYSAGDMMEVGIVGTIIYLEAAAAVTRGASLEYVPTGVLVKTALGVNPTVGKALDSAPGANALIRVLVTSQVELSETIDGGSFVNGAISASTINASIIGGSTPAAGTFTNLAATGTLAVTGVTTITGALNANGGIDRSTAAALAIGATNATAVNVTPATHFLGTVLVTGALSAQAGINFAADSQSTDTYVITLAPAIAAYTAGLMISFTANTANTGACSINVNGLGAKALKLAVSTDPGNSYIKAGSVVVAVYDGTNFQMLQPAAA